MNRVGTGARGACVHDLIVRDALICDGTGAAAQRGSVAVDDGRVSVVGEVEGPAREVVDAGGLVLAPGIIDSHTHYDAQVLWDPWLTPSPAHGVTTVIVGNCGFTIAPCRPEHRELTMANLVKVEGMSMVAMQAGIPWEFESFGQYLDTLERRGTGVNVAAYLGHSSLRTYVMGDAAAERAATVDEVREMCAVVRQAMCDGAVGFATSTSPSHNGAGGRPMPSRLADDGELGALVEAMGESGRGVFMLTKGGHTTIPFLEDLAARCRRPVMVAALLHNSTRPQAVFDDLDRIRGARARGRQLWGQVSCCPLTMDFTLESPYPFEGIGAWAPAMRATPAGVREVLADPSFRAAVRRELETPAPVRLFNGEWGKISVMEVAHDARRALEGRSIAALAAADGVDPLDWMLDLALAEDLATSFAAVLLNSDETAVKRLLTDDASSIALSDAGAHLTFFCDVGFGLRLLGHWVRERGALSLEAAVHRLSGQPAAIYGLADRGRIEPGAHADLWLFDPGTVGRSRTRRVYDLPAGSPRLVTEPLGVHGVWVNGARVVDQAGVPVDARPPGRVLRKFRA
jgi:N-acyl-D-aspartate/D-glutamate deacylase